MSPGPVGFLMSEFVLEIKTLTPRFIAFMVVDRLTLSVTRSFWRISIPITHYALVKGMMSTHDQHGERYGTATANAFEYKRIGSLQETITLPAIRRWLDGLRRLFPFIQVKNEN